MARGKRGPIPPAIDEPTAEEIVGQENVVTLDNAPEKLTELVYEIIKDELGYQCADRCGFTSDKLSALESHVAETGHGGGSVNPCEQCVSEGRISTVSAPTFGQATQIPWAPFYDKDDREKFHDHDPNRHTLTYTCSNGHQWTEDWYRMCRCGWRVGPDEKSIEPIIQDCRWESAE